VVRGKLVCASQIAVRPVQGGLMRQLGNDSGCGAANDEPVTPSPHNVGNRKHQASAPSVTGTTSIFARFRRSSNNAGSDRLAWMDVDSSHWAPDDWYYRAGG